MSDGMDIPTNTYLLMNGGNVDGCLDVHMDEWKAVAYGGRLYIVLLNTFWTPNGCSYDLFRIHRSRLETL